MKFNKLLTLLLCCFFTLLASSLALAQEVEMADRMRADGKIYVVVAVVLVILLGILIYIFQTDKKLKKLEREVYSMEKK